MALTKSTIQLDSLAVEVFKTTLGEAADQVIIGKEVVRFAELLPDRTIKEYVDPTCQFTKWGGEESLTLSYPTDTGFSDKTLDNVTGEVKMFNAKEGFYFKQFDQDTLKFGLILNSIPDNSKVVTIDGLEYYQWQFKLVGWENFDFLKQETFKSNSNCIEVDINGKTFYRIYHDDGYKQHEDKVDGSYAVYHKTKKNHITGKTNYGAGRIGCIFKPKLFDAEGNFLCWVDLDIQNSYYTLTAVKKIINSAKYPLKFNDEFGYHPLSGGTADARANRTGVAKCNLSANGTVTTISACLNDANTSSAGVYNLSSGEPSTIKIAKASLAGTSQTKIWKEYNVTDTALTSGDWGLALFLADGNTLFYYDTDANYHIDWESGEFLDPFVLAFTDSNRRLWIYATYTPAGADHYNVIYVEKGTPTRQTILHQFEDHNTNNTDQIALSCNCQTNLSPLISTVYLQIYNRTKKGWETVTSNDTALANTDFTLSKTITTGLTDYYSADYWISCRVIQDVR